MTDIKRLFDFPYYQLEVHNLEAALVTKYNGEWIKTSTKDYIAKANAVSRALLKLGIQKNDKIAVISSTNRTEWNIMDIGILQTGAQNIPIYPTISAEDYEYVLNHSESIYCFVSDEEVLEKVNKVKANTKLKDVYSFDHIKGCKHYSELFELGKDESTQPEVESRKNNVSEDDLATIIYTSGTTGKPKGVMLTHKNIVSNALDSVPRLPLIQGETRVLSFLPICHIFERVLIYIYQHAGTSIYFAEGIDKIGDNAKEIKPNLMSVVPRLLEKVYDKIMAKAEELSGIKKSLFFWAVKLGEKWEPYGANGCWYEFQLSIARKLIFSKWKAALGGNLHTMVSGSAPLQQRLTRVFCAAGMQVMEGYGLTETSPVVSVGMYKGKNFKVGTVGKPIANVEVKIADDGEILIKGESLMKGYLGKEKETKDKIKNNWLHTGDIGKFDKDNHLIITDRKKDIIVTSGGDNIAPQKIENMFTSSDLISHVIIFGDNKPFLIALIFINNDYSKKNGINNEIDKYLKKINEKLSSTEKIRKYILINQELTLKSGFLTPTMKIKRKKIYEKYKKNIDDLYN